MPTNHEASRGPGSELLRLIRLRQADTCRWCGEEFYNGRCLWCGEEGAAVAAPAHLDSEQLPTYERGEDGVWRTRK
jgi:hypothetical protein